MTGPSAAESSSAFVYVDSAARLSAICEHLASVERFGLDTEFVGERTYVPQLELIQVATPTQCALIDCQAVQDLRPFFAIVCDAAIEKVLHAGQQDLEIFFTLCGKVPSPVFDVQVAAAMAGLGAQCGYAQVADRLLGVTIEKTETLTDWSHRPLTPAQLDYASDDVRYLLPVYEELKRRLTHLGRWKWLQEEFRSLEQSIRSEPVVPERAYLRVRGRGSLRGRGLAVLRELAAWREDMARERDKPRGSIVRDEALVEIARKAPTSVSVLRGLRAVRSRELDRHAEEVVARVARALALPKEQWPEPAPSPGPAPSTGVVELLQAVVRARADDAHIAPSLLATHADLQELTQRHVSGGAKDLPIMQGWRRRMAGNDLCALLDGRAAVQIDAQHGRIRLRPVIADEKAEES
jgi:ribonuclease D